MEHFLHFGKMKESYSKPEQQTQQLLQQVQCPELCEEIFALIEILRFEETQVLVLSGKHQSLG